MKIKLLIFVVSFLALIFFSKNTGVDTLVANDDPTPTEVSYKQLDERAKILSDYLASYNSPLQYHAQDFVDAADQYKLDWKMLPAIAGVESTFGKSIPGGYNAWGWGVYGTNVIYFKSWKDGIFTIAKGLRENYLNRGLQDPYSINRAYAASPLWGGKVTYFMNNLEKYSQRYQLRNGGLSQIIEIPKIAAFSGELL